MSSMLSTEASAGGLMAPCPFGAEVGNAEAALEFEGAADDLAIDALEALVGQDVAVESAEFFKEGAFALGDEEGGSGLFLELPDLLYAGGAAVQQVYDTASMRSISSRS